MNKFSLSEAFVEKYKSKEVEWGFNGLGYIVYKRTYSRTKPGGNQEEWWETCRRVVEGAYNMQRRHIELNGLGWNPWKAQYGAQEMYERMFTFKWLPPGRGIWAMGSQITEERGLYAALNNCSFVSTHGLSLEPTKPFKFLMDMSMLGVGVGFDTKGAGEIEIKLPSGGSHDCVIEDTREGWVDATAAIFDAFFLGKQLPVFDYSLVRKAGEPIKGFGGVASGPEPLIKLHEDLIGLLSGKVGKLITSRDITDIMNMIGVCVVSGNVRRSAEIAFGEPDDEDFLDLKNYDKNPERMAYGWTSNNSVFVNVGHDYKDIAQRIKLNGEPGLAWLKTMRSHGRLADEPNFKDHRVLGGNPCLEQSLESFELCCLVETFPAKHDTLEDYMRTLKVAYLYAKTVTLGQTHWPETNRVMLRNRRIGTSMSGIAQFIAKFDINTLVIWADEGYDYVQSLDETYSEWFVVPRSIKTTSVKPSGSVSLLAGATPGVHYPESRYYIRRMRLPLNSKLTEQLVAAGYYVEPAVEGNAMVVEVPVDAGEGVRTLSDVSMWEQFALAALLQRYWADNQVSCTITFDPKTEGDDIVNALNYYQYQLKGISLLPRLEAGAYAQMPYEEITQEQYENKVSKIGRIAGAATSEEITPDRFCDGDYCEV